MASNTPPQSGIIVPSELAGGFSETKQTEEVAVCRALGVELVPGAEVRREYSKTNPYNNGRPEVVFCMNGASSTWQHQPQGATGNPIPLPTNAIRQAFQSRAGEPVAKLDDLVEQIENKELKAQINNVLPLAFAAYGRAFMDARRDCMRIINTSPEHIRGVTRSGRKYNVNRNARDFAKRMGIE